MPGGVELPVLARDYGARARARRSMGPLTDVRNRKCAKELVCDGIATRYRQGLAVRRGLEKGKKVDELRVCSIG